MKIPPYLKKGDTIGILCPSGFMPFDKVQTCILTLKNWGYKVVVGKTVGHQNNYFSGTDEERLDDLQCMLNDKNIKAILCARGGYGLSRIIDRIDFSLFKKNPKWIIGYSDITLLQSHINTHLKIASLHSPMAAAFNDDGFKNEYIQALQKTLKGNNQKYNCAPHSLNKTGKAAAELVGGNLSLIAHSIGTSSSFQTKNKILFLEDIGEYLYHIDRLFIQLKRSGLLKDIKGLILGGFTEMKDTIIPFGKSIDELIYDHTKHLNIPVCFHFPVGHQTENYPLKIGVKYQLEVTSKKVSLKEI
jgi:muramoyltetrapeptide carboxypeptidase